ncbi:MAG: hypothetical protein ACP5RH_02600 [Leptodesmis sp.]|uniref:hypothetical protein n=1 Tax=Leptodesmis sp. TaxID=3100501 RepID=UPI003D0A52BF
MLSAGLGVGGLVEPPAIAQTELAQTVETEQRPILFRTKRYVVEIIWRRGQPLMSVSNNGFRVIVNAPARILSARGINDQWTTYTANSGDYTAIVRVGAGGERMIEVSQVGQRIVQEYATTALQQQPDRPAPLQQDATLLSFQTGEYAVRVYRQKNRLYMNLYNQSKGVTELKQVPVVRVESSAGTTYRYDGKATVQVREDYRGQRVLLILQNNQIQYRGDGY